MRRRSINFAGLSKVVMIGQIVFASRVSSAMPTPGADDPPAYAAAAVARGCPGPVATGGADVSNFNVGNDWRAFARTGRGFGIVKATEGLTLANRRFGADWSAIKAAGLVRGAYHFFHPDRDPVQQATFFVKTVGRLGAGDLPLIMDWEISAGRSPAEQIAYATAFLTAVETLSHRVPIIYTAPSFFDALGNPRQFARYPLFIAHYGVSCPRVPAPWTAWTLWQYAAAGTVPGIAGTAVDQDLFNGSWAQLNALAR